MLLHICIESVHHIHQCHLALYTALHQFLDALCGEIHITLQQIVIGRVYVEQHLVNFGIDIYCLMTLAYQSARTYILFRATKNLVQITRFYTYYPNNRR